MPDKLDWHCQFVLNIPGLFCHRNGYSDKSRLIEIRVPFILTGKFAQKLEDWLDYDQVIPAGLILGSILRNHYNLSSLLNAIEQRSL